MEKTINQQLDELFDKWENKLSPEHKQLFCRDGLMLRPTGEDVNELWLSATRRVAFLLKDKSDSSCDDIRSWLLDKTNGKHNRELRGGKVGKTGFLPNIARVLYGLLNVSVKDNNLLGFDEVNNDRKHKVIETWSAAPVALIETKKVAGVKTVADSVMQEALKRDNLPLQEELNILKPNILVCCDANDSQFKFVTQTYFAGKHCVKILDDSIEYVDVKPCCLYYYPEVKIAVIKSYHPTRLGKQDWMVYERVVCTMRKLLKEIPEPFEKLK